MHVHARKLFMPYQFIYSFIRSILVSTISYDSSILFIRLLKPLSSWMLRYRGIRELSGGGGRRRRRCLIDKTRDKAFGAHLLKFHAHLRVRARSNRTDLHSELFQNVEAAGTVDPGFSLAGNPGDLPQNKICHGKNKTKKRSVHNE